MSGCGLGPDARYSAIGHGNLSSSAVPGVRRVFRIGQLLDPLAFFVVPVSVLNSPARRALDLFDDPLTQSKDVGCPARQFLDTGHLRREGTLCQQNTAVL